MARIVAIEDDPALQRVLDYNLRHAGHDVVGAFTAAEGLRAVHVHHPDLVLLDLMLPDAPGTDVVRALHADARTATIPVVIVSARGDECDRVVAFELGVSDYVVKPFSVRELVLRIGAVLRRRHSAPPVSPGATIGALRISPDAHRAWVDDREIELTVLEFKLLNAFVENTNRVLTRGALLERVWGIDGTLTTRTVDTHIKRLRDKLGPVGNFIQTVRGIGYRFSDEPEESAVRER